MLAAESNFGNEIISDNPLNKFKQHVSFVSQSKFISEYIFQISNGNIQGNLNFKNNLGKYKVIP